MTTLFTESKNPRLPDNYAEHLDRVAPDKWAPDTQGTGFALVGLLFLALGLLALCAFAYANLSS